jgi:hypothetical protein
MGDPSLTLHTLAPEGLTWDIVMAVRDETTGIVSLVEDPVKVQAKLDAQWASVRAQQRQKLYESDWTCSVIDPPPEILAARDAWLQYRAALRDVTTQADPFNIEWPVAPSSA